MLAKPHARQQERLAALYSYEILDTDKEKPFDDIVALIARICETEVALISFVDADRQFFKAEVGMDASETPLEQSICSHVILQNEFVEIYDTALDPRTVDNPLCAGTAPMRFYAGALLVSDNGMPLGTLCVLHSEPKVLTPLQRDAMKVMAQQVMSQLNLRRALKAAEILHSEVDHRVKNSLQAVSALTRLQARGLQTDEAREALDTVQRRIETVAALHEQLYRTNAGNEVDLAQYFGNVANFIRGSSPENVTLDCKAESVMISSAAAAALGVVLNEFATNSLKYAFADGRPGVIEIDAKLLPDNVLRVTLRDDGPGAADGIAGEGKGIGLRIIEASVEQLGGSYEIHHDHEGMSASFSFPL